MNAAMPTVSSPFEAQLALLRSLQYETRALSHYAYCARASDETQTALGCLVDLLDAINDRIGASLDSADELFESSAKGVKP